MHKSLGTVKSTRSSRMSLNANFHEKKKEWKITRTIYIETDTTKSLHSLEMNQT